MSRRRKPSTELETPVHKPQNEDGDQQTTTDASKTGAEATSAEIKDAIEVAPNEKPSSSKESSTSSRRMYGSSDMVKVFIPVSLCMLIVVLCVRNIEDYSDDYVIPAPYVIYREPDSEPTTMFWQSLVNAGVLLGIIVVATCILLLLFYLRCFYCLIAFVVFAVFSLLTVVLCMQYQKILEKIDFPVSLVLVVILHYNAVVVAMMSIFWKGPMKMQQGTLIIVSAVITLTLMQLLPKWTTWTLMVVIAIWDLIAVLTPCGPLRILVSIAEKRGDNLTPVLIYTGSMFFSQSSEGSGENKPENSSEAETKDELSSKPSPPGSALESLRMPSISTSDDEEQRSIRIGLGDFIFYSLLVGTASATGDWATTLACYVSILTGLGFTLVLLVVLQQPLPALPISIVFGLFAFFASSIAMSKLVLEFNRKIILV